MRFDSFLNQTVDDLRAANLLREPDDGAARRSVDAAARKCGVSPIDASSNDYLGLASFAVSRETVGAQGAAASRLIHGTAPEHLLLEEQLAAWTGMESSLLFASAYSANLGVVSALGARDTLIISDAANHASIIDGARLSRAEVRIVEHLDLDAVRSALGAARKARACWMITESYFSMDGDGPDLGALRELCDDHDASLIVDEAHGLGVFGPGGAGRCAEAGVKADVLVGALGKAAGSHGGFVAGSNLLRTFLWNRARSFVFSTAPSPRHAELTTAQVQRAQGADTLRERLAENGARFRAALHSAGLRLATHSFGPIVSIVLGSNERVLAAAAELRAKGILAQAIRPPTVPAGGARLRLTMKATFTESEIARLAQAVVEACHAS